MTEELQELMKNCTSKQQLIRGWGWDRWPRWMMWYYLASSSSDAINIILKSRQDYFELNSFYQVSTLLFVNKILLWSECFWKSLLTFLWSSTCSFSPSVCLLSPWLTAFGIIIIMVWRWRNVISFDMNNIRLMDSSFQRERIAASLH